MATLAVHVRRSATRLSAWQVGVAFVVVAVLLRVPFLTVPLGIDEGGYAYVATHWGTGDGGMYGAQWVDRPPLLIAMYAGAIFAFGDLGVRLLGCVVAALLVASCVGVAYRVAGMRAMAWTGVAAVTLSSTTMLQSHTVNAELPAAAFVAACMWLVVEALARVRTDVSVLALSAGAGVAGAGAVFVKQSFPDGLVFAAVVLGVASVLGRGRASVRRRVRTILLGGVLGVALVVSAVAAWAELRGPGIGALVDAMYGFRIAARDTIVGSPAAPTDRAVLLGLLVALSGLLALFALTWLGLLRIAIGRQATRVDLESLRVRATAAGLCAMGLWGALAITQGGNWWRHYLIQLVPMLAIGIGVVVGGVRDARRSKVVRSSRRAVHVVVTVAALAWAGTAAYAGVYGLQPQSTATGDWLRAAARPGDTALVAWGQPNVLYRSGMSTPYDLVWSLPMRVRDADLAGVRRVLAGPDAPTWIVEWRSFDSWGLDPDERVRSLVAQRYERVSSVCGKAVYRLRGAGSGRSDVPAPPSSDACEAGVDLALDLPGIPTW